MKGHNLQSHQFENLSGPAVTARDEVDILTAGGSVRKSVKRRRGIASSGIAVSCIFFRILETVPPSARRETFP
jgi:hypothetical protein